MSTALMPETPMARSFMSGEAEVLELAAEVRAIAPGLFERHLEVGDELRRGLLVTAALLQCAQHGDAGLADLEAITRLRVEDKALVREGELGEAVHILVWLPCMVTAALVSGYVTTTGLTDDRTLMLFDPD